MPMPLLGSLSQPHSSSSNSLALIGLHPYLLSLIASSALSRKRYRCTWSGTALSHQLPHLNCICGQLSPSIDTELIPGTALCFFPCWYLSVPLSTVVWKPGNDVAYQFDWRWGYNTVAGGIVAGISVPQYGMDIKHSSSLGPMSLKVLQGLISK